MKLALLVLLAACHAGADDDFPINPGGGGGGGGGGGVNPGGDGDGGGGDGGDGDAGIPVTGKVCLLTDLRDVGNKTKCAVTIPAGVVVSIGTPTRTASAALDGTFSILAPIGSGFSWHVTGGNLQRSAMPYGTDNTIPVFTSVRYSDLLGGNGNGVMLPDLSGSLVVRLVTGATPVANVTATSVDAVNPTLYDGTSKDVFEQRVTGTGPAGIAWLPVVSVPNPARASSVTLTPQGQAAITTSATIEDQTVTFVTQNL